MKPIREAAELDWSGEHMIETYTIFRHETQPDGLILTRVEDNDDNDDGWPDAKVETYTLGPSKKAVAMKPPMDKSHRGCAGRSVRVFLDGKELK